MPEKVGLGVDTYGYDTLIREDIYTELHGDNKPPLKLGMKIVFKADTEGYVRGHFDPGGKGVIIGFRDGNQTSSTDVVQVTDGQKTGWVKVREIELIANGY